MATPTGTIYNTQRWRDVRLIALQRDGYKCRVCGADVRGKQKARVDHIHSVKTHPHLALELWNLRSLCTTCDNQAHREKGLGGGARIQRFVPIGVGVDGWPIRRAGK